MSFPPVQVFAPIDLVQAFPTFPKNPIKDKNRQEMKMILAKINDRADLERGQDSAILKICRELGLDPWKKVYSLDELKQYLNQHRSSTFLLFSNFPPNSTFPLSGHYMNVSHADGCMRPSWPSDNYSIITRFYRNLDQKYRFRAIHFLTGAPTDSVDDERITSLFNGTRVSIQRRQDWLSPMKNYFTLYEEYMLGKINESRA